MGQQFLNWVLNKANGLIDPNLQNHNPNARVIGPVTPEVAAAFRGDPKPLSPAIRHAQIHSAYEGRGKTSC
jgi:hypothetical protein